MRPFAVAVIILSSIAALVGWALELRTVAIADARAILSRFEHATMTEWTHTLQSGGQIHVVIYRRDYATEELYDAAVAAKLVLYPPDPPAGGGGR